VIDQGYTSPARLATEGGSNGGLLMGAVLTQHQGVVPGRGVLRRDLGVRYRPVGQGQLP